MRALLMGLLVLLLGSAMSAPLESSAGDIPYETTGIRGKVTVSKDSSGKVTSVTITNKRKSCIIAPIVAQDKVTGRKFKITLDDIEKIAKYEGQSVHVFLKCLGGKPVDVSNMTVVAGDDE